MNSNIDFWQTKTLNFEIQPCNFLKIFLRFSSFEPNFLINLFLIEKRVMYNYAKQQFQLKLKEHQTISF